MKKLFVIFYLFIAFITCKSFVSCKNEEKSKQLVNSSSQIKVDTNNGNKPDNTSSILINPNYVENNNTPKIETGIYQGVDSLYHLKYILEEGKTYLFNSKEINKQSLTIKDKSQSLSQESYDPVSFTVMAIKDDVYTLQVKMGGKKVITKADGEQSVFDTNGKKPENPDQAKMWKVYKAVSNATFTLYMDIYGNVVDIKGMDAIYNQAKNSLRSDLNGKELEDFIKVFKQSLNRETFKAQFEGSIMRFPSKGLKIGEKWNNDPSQKNKGYYQLAKVNENTTEINLQGIIPSKNDSKVVDGVTHKRSLKGTQNGKIIIDNKSGWISKATLYLSITETESAKKGEESMQIIQKSTNNTYIN